MALSRFNGSVSGNGGEATRMGNENSGFYGWVQNKTAQISTRLWHDSMDDTDRADITLRGSSVTSIYATLSIASSIDITAIIRNADDPEVRRLIETADAALTEASNRAREIA